MKIIIICMGFFILFACNLDNKNNRITQEKIEKNNIANSNINESKKNEISNDLQKQEKAKKKQKQFEISEERKKYMQKRKEHNKRVEDAYKNMDFSHCKKILKDENHIKKCMLDILFSSNNKIGCVVIQGEASYGEELYNKCTEIHKSIIRYKKIKKDKDYYNIYYDTDNFIDKIPPDNEMGTKKP